MAKNKEQLHLYIRNSTKESLDDLTAKANSLSNKNITRNELVGVILTEFLNSIESEDDLKDLLVKYVLA